MADRWHRLRRRIARDGLRATVAKFVGDHVYRSSDSVVLECHWRRVRAAPPRSQPGMDFRMVRRGEAAPPLCPWLAPRRRDFAAMLEAGKVGLFVLRDGVAVGCAWMALSDHHDARVREHYPVGPSEAYQYSLLLDPAERPRGTAMIFMRWTFGIMPLLGVERLFVVVDRENHASYRVLQHFGYREAGTLVRHRHLFHWRWTRMSAYRGTLGIAGPRQARARR